MGNRRRPAVAVAALIAGLLGIVSSGQVRAFGPALRGAGVASGQFASGVTLVEVYATVTDEHGAAVENLTKGDFTVAEDGAPQVITTFASGDFPLSVALAIDRSWSMAGERLAMAKAAARAFLGQLRPGDQSMLIAVASDTQVVAPLSVSRDAALAALSRLDPWSTTGLHDAIIACVGLIQPASGRRALILLSDGVDRYSQASASDVVARVRASDVLVYPIAIGKTRPPLFPEIAALTGGQSYLLSGDPRRIDETLSKIANELRRQYLLGYTPSRPIDPRTPQWRAIQVRVNRPGAKVRARDGYLAR